MLLRNQLCSGQKKPCNGGWVKLFEINVKFANKIQVETH